MVINIFKITANWFPNQRFTFLIGLTMTLGLMGPLFINFIFSGMITRIGPWDALYIITLFGLVVGVLYVIFARDSREALIHHTKDNKPRHLLSKIGLIIRNPQNWYLAFFYALAFSPLPLFAGLWGSPFLMQEFHASHPEALKGDALLLLGFAIGALFLGFFQQNLKKRKVILQCEVIGSFVLFLILLYMPGTTYFPGYLQSFAFGFVNSTVIVTFAMIHDINPFILTGTVMGFMFTIQAVLASVNDPLIGFLSERVFHNSSNNLLHALSIILVYLVVAYVLLIFIKETTCKHPSHD